VVQLRRLPRVQARGAERLAGLRGGRADDCLAAAALARRRCLCKCEALAAARVLHGMWTCVMRTHSATSPCAC
jgi:hypothetical protein